MTIGPVPRTFRTAFVQLLVVVLAGVGTPAGPATAQAIQWQHRFSNVMEFSNQAALAADPSGHVYVTRLGPGFGANLVKLDAGGTILWTVPLPSPWICASCFGSFTDLDADLSGAYVVGSGGRGLTICPVGCGNSFVIRFEPSDGTSSFVYATGTTQPVTSRLFEVEAAPGGAAITVGYDATSGLLVRAGPAPFERRFGRSFGRVLVLDSGAIVATAHDTAATYLQRYDVVGNLQWSTPVDAAGCDVIAADPGERVACLGASGVVVLNANGTPAWGPITPDAKAMAFDAAGSLWLAGRTCSGSGSCQASAWKYGAGGNLLIADTIADSARTSEWRALSIGPAGDVYVTGLSRPLPNPGFQPSDMITARHDNAGMRHWLATYSGAGNWNDVGDSLIATADGVIVGGIVHDASLPSLAVLKYGAAVLVAPTFALSAVPNPAPPGTPVTLTATLSGATPPTGTVTFAEGSTAACAAITLVAAGATTAAATCVLAASGPGARQATATYSGDATYAAATSSLLLIVADDPVHEVPVLPPWLVLVLALLLAASARRRLR